MKKKLASIVACLALASAALPGLPAFAAGTTWYVDDGGGVDFTTISAAVAAAAAGDTVIVKDGTYSENVTVDRSLTIQSENGAATTIVQGASTSADVFSVAASDVTIDGFTVSGATSTGKSGIRVGGSGISSCTIINNVCTGNNQGITVEALAANNAISNNTCTLSGRYGIYLSNTTGNTVTGNTVSDNTAGSGYGLYLADNADSNTVYSNTCESNGYGIRVKAADNNTLYNNTSSGNNYGLEIATGSIGNVFYLNNFIDNTSGQLSSGFGSVAGNTWNSQEQLEYSYNGTEYTGYMGNHWSNYAGADADSDGIGDTPYATVSTDSDNYPLMDEYGTYFPPPTTSASLSATVNIVIGMLGIELDRDSIDYGSVGPGESSAVETVGITNTGTLNADVTLEVDGVDDTAQSFFEQSLFIDSSVYNVADVIASIDVGLSDSVPTQLHVPEEWIEGGLQEAQFIFWVEAVE